MIILNNYTSQTDIIMTVFKQRQREKQQIYIFQFSRKVNKE